MKAFIINLPKDTDRRFFMEEQMKGLGLPFEIIPGTVGKDLTPVEREKLTDDNLSRTENGYALSNTQIACADSHRKAYLRIKELGLPWGLVLEDDVLLEKEVLTLLDNNLITASKADWIQIDYVPADLTYLTNWFKNALRQDISLLTKLGRILFRFPLVIIWSIYERARNFLSIGRLPRIVHFARPLYLASAYIITSQGIDKILPLTDPIRFAADSLQNVAPSKVGLVLRGVVPLLAKQARQQFSSNMIYDNN